MKKLLNTLYLTQDNFYLTRERDNIVIKQEGKVISRFPYRIIDGIVCFSYLGASPSLTTARFKFFLRNRFQAFDPPTNDACTSTLL